MSGATEIQSSVLYFSTEFEKLEAAERKCQGPFRVKWAPPVIRGYLHDQHHGVLFPETKGGRLGFVARDKTGDVVAVGAGDIRCAAWTFQTEAIVAHSHRSIQRASELVMTGIILETDGIGRRPKLEGDWSKSHKLFSASD